MSLITNSLMYTRDILNKNQNIKSKFRNAKQVLRVLKGGDDEIAMSSSNLFGYLCQNMGRISCLHDSHTEWYLFCSILRIIHLKVSKFEAFSIRITKVS